MTSITMTAEQTAIYDDGSEQEQCALMAELRQRAVAMGGAVEIYTADGIVAEYVQRAEDSDALQDEEG